eukprot:3824975-Rhodomonas_salina.1
MFGQDVPVPGVNLDGSTGGLQLAAHDGLVAAVKEVLAQGISLLWTLLVHELAKRARGFVLIPAL